MIPPISVYLNVCVHPPHGVIPYVAYTNVVKSYSPEIAKTIKGYLIDYDKTTDRYHVKQCKSSLPYYNTHVVASAYTDYMKAIESNDLSRLNDPQIERYFVFAPDISTLPEDDLPSDILENITVFAEYEKYVFGVNDQYACEPSLIVNLAPIEIECKMVLLTAVRKYQQISSN